MGSEPVCVYVYASEKFSLNEFSTNAGRITMRLEGMVDLTMLKWFLMETVLGLASFPGCRPQIRICSSTANEKKIKLTSGGKYPRANPKISKQPHRSDEILIPTDQILHEVTQESSVGDEISNQSIEIAATTVKFGG